MSNTLTMTISGSRRQFPDNNNNDQRFDDDKFQFSNVERCTSHVNRHTDVTVNHCCHAILTELPPTASGWQLCCKADKGIVHTDNSCVTPVQSKYKHLSHRLLSQ